MQSWARDNLAMLRDNDNDIATTRQRDRALVTAKYTKNVEASASKWSSRNENNPNAINYLFLA